MTEIDPVDGQEKTVEVICKTAQIDKNQKFAQYLQEELLIIEKLTKVVGVVQCHGIQKVKNSFNNDALEQHVILEFCSYGSLHSLSVFTKPYDEHAAFIVIRQVAQALQNVHRENILHLDIKESNILISFNRENQFQTNCGLLPLEFKLADWGVSRDLSNKQHVLNKQNLVYHRGTPRYMAPEQNVNKPVDDIFKVEVFSLGIVLFRLLFKCFPFSTDNMHEEARDPNFLLNFMNSEKNLHKVRPSNECILLLKRMLAYKQSDRCSLSEVLSSDWFNMCEFRLKRPEILERAK